LRADLNTSVRWCPGCGDEFRPGFDRCPDCDLELIAAPPVPAASPPVDHGLVVYELADWTRETRLEAELLLRAADIVWSWDGTELHVPAAREAEVDQIIDGLDPTRPIRSARSSARQRPRCCTSLGRWPCSVACCAAHGTRVSTTAAPAQSWYDESPRGESNP
jgi:hypothetical protein